MAAILYGLFLGLTVADHFNNLDASQVAAFLPSLAGLVGLGLGAFLPHAPAGGWWGRPAPILACYALAMFVLNANWIVSMRWVGAYTFVALLVPFVVAGVVCPRRGEWLTAAGAIMFLFASVVAMAAHAKASPSGVGFWTGWLA
jgi:hypothetical protein